MSPFSRCPPPTPGTRWPGGLPQRRCPRLDALSPGGSDGGGESSDREPGRPIRPSRAPPPPQGWGASGRVLGGPPAQHLGPSAPSAVLAEPALRSAARSRPGPRSSPGPARRPLWAAPQAGERRPQAGGLPVCNRPAASPGPANPGCRASPGELERAEARREPAGPGKRNARGCPGARAALRRVGRGTVAAWGTARGADVVALRGSTVASKENGPRRGDAGSPAARLCLSLGIPLWQKVFVQGILRKGFEGSA